MPPALQPVLRSLGSGPAKLSPSFTDLLAAGSHSGSMDSWSDTTTIQTNDPVTGTNETRVIAEASHQGRDQTIAVIVGVVGGVLLVCCVGYVAWKTYLAWKDRKSAERIARIKNPECAAAERQAEAAEKAARRSEHPRNGQIPKAARWIRKCLWDGEPEPKPKLTE